MKRVVCLTLMLMLMALAMTSCSMLGSGKQADKSTPASSSQTDTSEQSQGEEKKEEKVVQGTINKIDTYLVLLTEDGEYQVMDYGEGVTLDDFFEGDKVEVTYTGELGVDSSTPVIVSIAKVK